MTDYNNYLHGVKNKNKVQDRLNEEKIYTINLILSKISDCFKL
jgi:hypothetical protein